MDLWDTVLVLDALGVSKNSLVDLESRDLNVKIGLHEMMLIIMLMLRKSKRKTITERQRLEITLWM